MNQLIVRKNPDYLMRELGESINVISLVDGEEFSIDGYAMKLLQNVDGQRKWGEILDLVCAEGGIEGSDREDFNRQAHELIKELIANKIVIAS